MSYFEYPKATDPRLEKQTEFNPCPFCDDIKSICSECEKPISSHSESENEVCGEKMADEIECPHCLD
jgi:hypothetical protein